MPRRAPKAAKRTKPKSGGADWRERLRARLEAEEARLSPKERAALHHRRAAAEARVRALAPGLRLAVESAARIVETPPLPLSIAEALRDGASAGDGQSESSTLPVDDEYFAIVRSLSDNARDVLRFLFDNTVVDRASRYPKPDMADELGLTLGQVRVVCRNLAAGSLGIRMLESMSGHGGGIWLSPPGVEVAKRIPPQTCRHFKPQSTPKRHSNGTQ
jgi:hypothetical protein